MRLTKIGALGDEINENKKISPVLKKNIMKKTKQRILYVYTVYLNGSTYGNKSARSLNLCFDARPCKGELYLFT
jgi:hypothetical protein